MAGEMSINLKNAETFANQFDPPLIAHHTERVNGVPMADAYSVAFFDKETGWGITAVFYKGQHHSYLEAIGDEGNVAETAQMFRKALGK